MNGRADAFAVLEQQSDPPSVWRDSQRNEGRAAVLKTRFGGAAARTPPGSRVGSR
jgi:hypothetical protein